MRLASILEAGRRDFLDAAGGISARQATCRASLGAWTPLEIIEHVVIAEERYLAWLADGDGDAPLRDVDKELRLFLMIRNRSERRKAPDALWPQGRFTKLPEALEAFNEARDRGIALADESLYAVGIFHPFFGRLNGAETMQLIDGHARRHADQIREIDDVS